MSQLDITPPTFDMGSTESLPLAFNVGAILGSETISSASATLTDMSSGALYPTGLSGTASISGGVIISQTVSGLVPLHRYRLAVTFTTSSFKIWTVDMIIVCPF